MENSWTQHYLVRLVKINKQKPWLQWSWAVGRENLHAPVTRVGPLTPREEPPSVCHMGSGATCGIRLPRPPNPHDLRGRRERLLLTGNSSANGSPPEPANERPQHFAPSASSSRVFVYNSPSQARKIEFLSCFSGLEVVCH